MHLVDLAELATALVTISALNKVIIDLIKAIVPKVQENSDMKYLLSVLIPVIITVCAGISLFDTANMILFYVGAVAAGFIASLGSEVIHEVIKILQTVKGLNKPKK